jgi:protein-S-isoprenylcysteine O-methyltransferase Ste14
MNHDSTVKSSGVRVFPPLLYAAGIGAGYLLHWYWPVRPVPTGSGLVLVARAVGWVFITASIMLPIWAVRLFHHADTTPNPMRPTTALVFTGPYRFTRNPMYLGLALLQAGLAMVTNALWPLLTLAPVIMAVRRLVIDREERYLEAKFGEEYRAYKTRVRRWL